MTYKIKEIRNQIGLKQYKVAEKLNISSRHYARLENHERKPSEKELIELAKIFNCKIEDLQISE